jgi:signal transduction histidine kinase
VISFPVLISEIAISLGNIINKENVNLHTNFDAAERVITIKSYMHSILYNLIINAIKYKTPGVDPVISIFTRRNGQKLSVLIKDNGRGIDKKNFDNLFGLYKRFDTSVEGKGMGLFMVKMQVESLGGKIEIQSEKGHGTTFKLEFSKVKFPK